MRKFFQKRKRLFINSSILILLIFLIIWTDPTSKIKGTIKIYDKDENLIYETSNSLGHQESTTIDKIPKYLKDAVIITEDKRFRYHVGIDPIAIIRAIYQDIKSRKIVSGASTIPQQLARFSVISPQSPSPLTIFRKARETLIAIRLSLVSPKEKVLEQYLNTMHFGRQTYGVAAASRLYFDKNIENLSPAQSALLAGMISNPTLFDPIRFPQGAIKRRNDILLKLYSKKLLDTETYERAKEEPLPDRLNQIEIVSPHAVQMVLSEVKAKNIKSDKGISVYTTLDSGWYSLTREIALKQVERLKREHDLTNSAVVILENKTGKIVTLLGSIDYFNESIGGQNNMALALRQPGSAMKPVTYAAAFEDKLATPATAIEDSPKVYLTLRGEGFLPHNYDGRYRGIVLAREALASSYNLPAVEMLSRVGIGKFLDLAHKMGVTSMQQTDRYDLALTLGGGEVNLLELTNLYATFARSGLYKPTFLIEKIIDNSGKTVYLNNNTEGVRALDERAAYLITDILSDKRARIPTFGEKNLLLVAAPAAVKTGTTTDWHDNWTIGYTPDFTVGVWVGNSDNHPMRDITGITGAAPIWNQITSNLIRYKTPGSFIKPVGIVEKEICSWDGLLVSDKCDEQYTEKFIEGTIPNEYSSLTKKPLYLDKSNIQIISPIEGAIYEIGAASSEKINFEISKSEGIDKIYWFLDGKKLNRSDCGEDVKVCHWTPILGKHILNVEVEPASKEVAAVHFSVQDYKKDW